MADTNGNGNGTEGRIYFTELEVENFMRIRHAHVFLPERGIVPVTGANRQGKTSLRRAFGALVGGAKEVEPEARNRDTPDDETPFIRGRISDGTELHIAFTGAKSAPKGRLTAVDGEGRRLNQSHLTQIVGSHALRPMQFLDLKESEQREVILGFVPGLKDELAELAERRTEIEEERRPHNSQLQVLTRVAKPEGEKPSPVDSSAETERLQLLQRKKRDRDITEQALTDAEKAIEDNHEARLGADDAIKAAQEALRAAQKGLEDAINEKQRLAAASVQLEELRIETVERLAAYASVDDDMQAILDTLASANRINESLEPWREWEKAQVSIEEHRAEAKRLTAELEAIEERKRVAVAEADLPFTGLDFAEDGSIRLGGSAITAASGADRLIFAMEVAVAENPKLRAIFANGNELDHAELLRMHQKAVEWDLTVIMDMIHSPDFEGEVRMVDGVAHQGQMEIA